MHDLMNDFAASVAGDFCFRLDKEMKKDALEKYRHMSFIREEYVAYGKFKAFERAKSLRTFLAVSDGVGKGWYRCYLSNKILDDLLPRLPLLRVICLSCFEICEVPESIGSLKHLRYLNLSRTSIECLPENVCNLYNLEILIVTNCYMLTKLPNSFMMLKKLRHFDIRGTHLQKMPFGIDKLKNLQTLPRIIIVGDDDFAIPELKNLPREISITRLGQLQNAMHAQKLKLSEKKFSELEMKWDGGIFDGSQKVTLAMEVLSVLKPHPDKLKTLSVWNYGGVKFPSWVGEPSFLQLAHVSISFCTKCRTLPPLGQLPSLKTLFISNMDEVKVVGSDFFGTNGVAFPSLESLGISNMKIWEDWSTSSGVAGAVFPCLQKLYIAKCPNLVEVSLEALPSLKDLNIERCGIVVLRRLVHVAPSVTNLGLRYILGLTDHLWACFRECLGVVEEIRINECNEIRHLWESEVEASKVFLNLRSLCISKCSSLVSLGEKEEEHCEHGLISLRMLNIEQCNNMERCICPNSIDTLDIYGCDSIASISFPTRGGQKLKSVQIRNCKKLLEMELGGGEKTRRVINGSTQMLKVLRLCSLQNMKEIINLSNFIHLTKLNIEDCPSLESFNDGDFASLVSLKHLRISDCPSMESFPDLELLNLIALKHLEIVNCPSMFQSFPGGLWPPNLCELHIGQLKKPLSQWGPQIFPASLVHLDLWGGSSQDISSCSQLSQLLPSSLTYLSVYDFEKLESLSMGLQHLTSLRHLQIVKCPKMIHLPEMLLPSLLSLFISNCPNLKERFSRSGSYWPIISHIPKITIF